MANIIGDLAVRIGADVTDFNKGLGEASRGLDGVGAKVRAGAGSFATYGAAAAAAGAAIVAGLVAKGMQAIDAQADLAAQLKTTSASIAVLNRAADLSGASMAQVETAGKKLAVVIGQADQGSKAAAATFNQLGLSASALAAMPLDERIQSINEAIAANIPVTQQAAVAAQLFGKEAGFAVSQIGGDALSQARREAELFGLALSEADAARVQQAADEFGKVGMAMEGVIQQLTINLAPAITAVMRMFTDAAEEAGGVGTAVAKSSSVGIKAFGFLLDVVDSLKRLWEILARVAETAVRTLIDLQLKWAEAVVNGPVWAANKLIELLNKLPGIDIEPMGLSSLGEKIRTVAEQNRTALDAAKISLAEIDAIMMRPMPSEKFARYVEEAKAAAAEVAALTGGGGGGGSGAEVEDKAQKEKADREAEYIADRLERLREANMTEMQLLLDKQMLELETINAGWEQKFLTDEAWNALMLETKARHEDELTAVEEKAAAARAKIAEAEANNRKRVMMNALSQMTTLMNSESRKQFEIGKAAAIAQAVINTYQAATGAYAAMASIPYVGPVLGVAAAAAAVASGMAQVNSIRSQSFGGGGAGAQATGSNTAAVNAASAPVGGGGGGGPAGGTLTVQGLSASSLFSGDAVSALAEELLNYQRKGGTVLLAG
jgi:hypothetical protein